MNDYPSLIAKGYKADDLIPIAKTISEALPNRVDHGASKILDGVVECLDLGLSSRQVCALIWRESRSGWNPSLPVLQFSRGGVFGNGGTKLQRLNHAIVSLVRSMKYVHRTTESQSPEVRDYVIFGFSMDEARLRAESGESTDWLWDVYERVGYVETPQIDSIHEALESGAPTEWAIEFSRRARS